MTPLTITSLTQGRLIRPEDWRQRLSADPPADSPAPETVRPPMPWPVHLLAFARRRPA